MSSSETPKIIRLYRYLSASWALKTIETGELRVSRLAALNDPFEFRPALPFINPLYDHKTVDEYLGFFLKEFGPEWGIICFSENISDPVIWSHYADSHSGIALGFDILQDDCLWPMFYPEERPTIDVGNFPTMTGGEAKNMVRRILSAKAPSWEYEKEQRVFVDLASARFDGVNHFHRIPTNCLKHVVLGINCTVTDEEVVSKLKIGRLEGVSVLRARRCLTRFKVLL